MPQALAWVSHLSNLIKSVQQYLVGRDYYSHCTDKKIEIKMLAQGPTSQHTGESMRSP